MLPSLNVSRLGDNYFENMSKPTFRLDCLPAETVLTVAQFLPAESALSLSRVCRSLRGIAQDGLVFKNIMEHQQLMWKAQSLNLLEIAQRSGNDAAVLARYNYFDVAGRSFLWEKNDLVTSKLAQRLKNNTNGWIRYAVADCKAFNFCNELDDLLVDSQRSHAIYDNVNIDQSLEYLPQLIIAKHPSLHSQGMVPALMSRIICASDFSSKPTETVYTDHRLAFSFCATILGQGTPVIPKIRSRKRRLDEKQDPLERFYDQKVAEMCIKLRQEKAFEDDQFSSGICQADAQIIIGAFSCLLRRAFRNYRVRRLIGIDYYTFILPFVLEMPLNHDSTWKNLPLPFDSENSSDSSNFDQWLQCHVHEMTSPAVIEDGEWVGCYSYNVGRPEFDAPMKGIFFKTSKENNGVHRIIATGSDSLGDFSLTGSMKRTGAMRLRKQYFGGRAWDFLCVMTPFGIAGLWGPPGMQTVEGTCWLWKDSWTKS